jgi:Epoxide hydrolase N terminus
MANEQPFQIAIAEEELSLLKRKLDDTRFPDEINDAGWAYGVPLADLRRLTERWRNGYDWRTHERELNALPMFTRPIEVEEFGELRVHYVHQRSSVKGAVPLLFVHGCKSSFYPSFLSTDRSLRTLRRARKLPGGDESVTVVDSGLARPPIFPRGCPKPSRVRLVGGHLEERIPRKALCRGIRDMLRRLYAHSHGYGTQLFNKLMISLGYTEYVTQGGDWGHMVRTSARLCCFSERGTDNTLLP